MFIEPLSAEDPNRTEDAPLIISIYLLILAIFAYVSLLYFSYSTAGRPRPLLFPKIEISNKSSFLGNMLLSFADCLREAASNF